MHARQKQQKISYVFLIIIIIYINECNIGACNVVSTVRNITDKIYNIQIYVHICEYNNNIMAI